MQQYPKEFVRTWCTVITFYKLLIRVSEYIWLLFVAACVPVISSTGMPASPQDCLGVGGRAILLGGHTKI